MDQLINGLMIGFHRQTEVNAEPLHAKLLSPYSTGNWVCVGYKTQMKSTQKI